MTNFSYIVNLLETVEAWERCNNENREVWLSFYERMAEREYYKFNKEKEIRGKEIKGDEEDEQY